MSTQRLTDTMLDSVSSVYFSEGFQSMLENHILLLIQSSGTQVMPVKNAIAHQFEGDFYGLLTSLDIPDQYHFTILRCNGFYSPTDYRSTLVNIIIPSFTDVDELQAIYSTSTGLSFG